MRVPQSEIIQNQVYYILLNVMNLEKKIITNKATQIYNNIPSFASSSKSSLVSTEYVVKKYEAINIIQNKLYII